MIGHNDIAGCELIFIFLLDIPLVLETVKVQTTSYEYNIDEI